MYNGTVSLGSAHSTCASAVAFISTCTTEDGERDARRELVSLDRREEGYGGKVTGSSCHCMHGWQAIGWMWFDLLTILSKCHRQESRDPFPFLRELHTLSWMV